LFYKVLDIASALFTVTVTGTGTPTDPSTGRSFGSERMSTTGHYDAIVIGTGAGGAAAAAREHRAFVWGFRRALLGAGLISFGRRIGLQGTAHVCGTLPTGIDPAVSVVNTDGRVHGLEGLYVVDGSVLPRSSRVNPSLTIFAWSLRVASTLAVSRRSRRPDDPGASLTAMEGRS
jgi:choline dehydrogenase-like flavoprotein